MADAILQMFLWDHGGAVVVIKSLGTEQISAGTVHLVPAGHIPASLPPKNVPITVHLKTFWDHARGCKGTILQGNSVPLLFRRKKIKTF